jgi:hypothetical protein
MFGLMKDRYFVCATQTEPTLSWRMPQKRIYNALSIQAAFEEIPVGKF